MATSVNWVSGVISVPRADMPVVQVAPEIRELDADAFRLELKDLEASVAGMPYTDTHLHITETVLSGIIYARFVRILPPYTIEFEDGQYGVSVVGANTNFLDVKVANQVSLLGNNSAGLQRIYGPDEVWAALAATHVDPATMGELLKIAADKARLAAALAAAK